MLRFRDFSIRRKLLLMMLLSAAVGLVFSAVALIGYATSGARASERQGLSTVGQITANNITAALLFNDARSATEVLNALRAKPEIDSACLYGETRDGEAQLFAHYYVRGGLCPSRPGAAGITEEPGGLTLVRAVEEKGDRIGWLRLRQNLDSLQRSLAAQVGITVAILAASFVISASIAFLMQRLLADPLLRLAAVARRVSEVRDYSMRADYEGHDELGRLIEDFNLMLHQLELRELEVQQAQDALWNEIHKKEQANEELAETLRRLRDAQDQLVQNERLASLGALVAGVAHEINTPVGIGVTAASTLQDRAARLRHAYESGDLKRSELERFLAVSAESAQILLKNLQRAADLIHSFKQVAVDQTSGERRHFDLKAYLDEILLSLAPRLRKAGCSVDVDCEPGIEMDSYPGAIAQIMTNLVSNSLVHAFEPGARGHIHVAVERSNDWITLRFRDDGRGIPKEHLGRIYDPFFTTKRGKGGSGLGLHIVFTLVSQILGGRIAVRSEPGQGTEFTVEFPAIARRAAA